MACSSCQVVGLVEREVAFEVKVEVGVSQYLRFQKKEIFKMDDLTLVKRVKVALAGVEGECVRGAGKPGFRKSR